MLLFSKFTACNSVEPIIPPVNPIPGEKELMKELMFEIDEGIKGDELIAKYKNDINSLDNSLENIYNALSPLQVKYRVSVLIYPTWLYKESGYGQGSPAVGVNRIDPSLLHTFNYFKSKNIGVYLEIYSSGIYTNQNGELGNQPLVKRRYLNPETIKGLSLDLDCLEDIFAKYDVVDGVRFHELMGSNAQKDNGHGFAVDLTLTTEIASICKKYNKKLLWGDHDWNMAYTFPTDYGMWLPNLEKACDILDGGLTIDFNINGWGSEIIALQYSCTMANFKNNNKWGYGVQSWWWQEKDAQSLPLWGDGSIRWYPDSYLNMPIELMAAFTLETFRRGGNLVQFEPSFYFFNFYNPAEQPANRVSQYEQIPDYSGKLILKRLVDILLNYDKSPSSYPSMNPADYYVNDRSQMMRNKWSEKPKTYYQNTITVFGDKVKVFDTYNSNIGTWYNSDENRYREWVFSDSVIDAIRVKVDFKMIDEMLVVKSKSGQLSAEFYNYMSTYYTKCDNLVSATTDGNFVGLTALNLKRNYAGKDNIFFGDPDEIVVARSNGTNLRFTVYEKVFVKNGVTCRNFAYVVDDLLTTQINSQFGTILSSDFIQLLGMRTQNILYVDNTRSLDNLLIATKTNNNQVQIKGKMISSLLSVYINKTIDINPINLIDVKCADANCDYADEIAFLLNDDSIQFYTCNIKGNYDFTLLSTLPNVGNNARKIMHTRWTTYFKE
jgi:hypothetical protein